MPASRDPVPFDAGLRRYDSAQDVPDVVLIPGADLGHQTTMIWPRRHPWQVSPTVASSIWQRNRERGRELHEETADDKPEKEQEAKTTHSEVHAKAAARQ